MHIASSARQPGYRRCPVLLAPEASACLTRSNVRKPACAATHQSSSEEELPTWPLLLDSSPAPSLHPAMSRLSRGHHLNSRPKPPPNARYLTTSAPTCKVNRYHQPSVMPRHNAYQEQKLHTSPFPLLLLPFLNFHEKRTCPRQHTCTPNSNQSSYLPHPLAAGCLPTPG